MRVLIASEAHFQRGDDGRVRAAGPEDYPFWSSYLGGARQVRVLGRIGVMPPGGTSGSMADGEAVSFLPLDDYRGPWQYLRQYWRLRRQAQEAVSQCDAAILRAPGAVAYLVWHAAIRAGKPYALEVLADPWEALAPGAARSLWRPLARRWSRWRLRRLCAEAPVIHYVTREWLQRRYPAAKAEVFSYSDVLLRAPACEKEMQERFERIRRTSAGEGPWHLGFIGSFEQLYKAPDVHLRAVRLCEVQGLNVRFSMMGEGRHRKNMEKLARRLGVAKSVQFLGQVNGADQVNHFLDQLDLFLMASRSEGLPRALIEAMARGCPAIGSSAGGIPELLAAEDLVEPGSAGQLAAKITQVLSSPARLRTMARRNLEASQAFRPQRVEPLRLRFLEELQILAAASSLSARSGKRVPLSAELRA